jgi:hypothetical protein
MYVYIKRKTERRHDKKQKKGVLLYSLDISSNHKSDETRHDYTAVCEDFVIWLRAL